jgi:hypothetical protein
VTPTGSVPAVAAPAGATSRDAAATLRAAQGERLVVGIGEYAVAASSAATIVTHALGSCIAVCIWDPQRGVAGLLHFLLPESRVNPERAPRWASTRAAAGWRSSGAPRSRRWRATDR